MGVFYGQHYFWTIYSPFSVNNEEDDVIAWPLPNKILGCAAAECTLGNMFANNMSVDDLRVWPQSQ